jgi:hypothetical protein
MQSFLRAKAIALALLIPTTILAASNVTVERLTEGCTSYPNYNSTTGIAGPWLIRADSTSNPELNGLQLSIAPFTNDGIDRFGFVRALPLPHILLPYFISNTHFSLPIQA